jgi:UDP-N-acetylmuramoylalanine--D-glutamate ligase
LIHHILSENGVKSFLAGNIGLPLIAEVDRITTDSVVVLELSSFQLEEIIQFKSHIALLLNVTPDHLDRYSSLADYFSAKKNIFKNQSKDDFMVLNYDDPLLREQAGGFGPGARTWFSLAHKDIAAGGFIEQDHIVLRLAGNESRISLKNNPLRGLHNLENILAASISAGLCGVDSAGIEAAITGFKGLPHRMEAAGKIGNVEFINDSKATNVDAALKSIDSIDPPMVLILGGKDKGGDFKQLKQAIRKKADAVLLLGKAAKTIAGQLPGLEEKFVFVKDLAEAAAVGYERLSKSGGIVLLAPGCASFDMFDNFEHRGEVFKKEVSALKESIERDGHG